MLDEQLFGRTRAALLRELYANPDRSLSFNELVRRLRSGTGAVSRELASLLTMGLIAERREGNQRLLSAALSSPIFSEVKALLAKTSGVQGLLRQALQTIETKVDLAVIFGSVAAGSERAGSDLDLFVIGTTSYSAVTDCLFGLEDRLGRKVQTLYFNPESATDRASLRKPATRALLSGPKVFVIADESTLERFLSADDGRGQKSKSRKPHKGSKTRAARR